jgi:pimeloyl-ACP methyl ester carboxylesterase
MSKAKTGYFRSGLPYTRFGRGPRPLVIFQGLMFENKPHSPLVTQMYHVLGRDYTGYSVLRKPGMPHGYTFRDMADDYAAMIREEFGGPVDVLGISTGGAIVQQFAADHPDLVRRLVIHSAAYTLNSAARAMQVAVGCLAAERRWRDAWATLLRFTLPPGPLARPQAWLASRLMSLDKPKDPSDLVITIKAEDQFNFRDRLAEIAAPTLLVAGHGDPFYTPTLFRETATGIPNARLILYPNMGHPAGGKQFARDVLAFLREGRWTSSIHRRTFHESQMV